MGLDLFLEVMRKRGLQGFQIEQARVAVEVYWIHFRAESRMDPSPVPSATGIPATGIPATRIAVNVIPAAVVQVGMKSGKMGPIRVTPAIANPEGAKVAALETASTMSGDEGMPGDWLVALAAVAREVGLRRYSAKTLKAYRHWVRDFSRFVAGTPIGALNESHAVGFLAHLATERKVAAATQNQAFSALLFLYANVLRIEMHGMEKTPRAARRQEVPIALTRGEVQTMLTVLEYPYKLFCQLLYGCGLRLNEGLMLRIQDLDLDGGALRVHYGKGDKSRSVPLPKTLVPALSKHLESVRGLFDSDLKVGYAGVFLPGLLDRKLPGAACSWPWQWVFPGGRLTVTEGDGKLRRFHLHESSVQKEIKSAADRAKFTKRVTAHTFRHSYATHLLQMGYDIRTVQELLGHNDVETTMIYTHVLQAMSGKVVSPLDV